MGTEEAQRNVMVVDAKSGGRGNHDHRDDRSDGKDGLERAEGGGCDALIPEQLRRAIQKGGEGAKWSDGVDGGQ